MTSVRILSILCLLVVPILGQDARSLAQNCESSYSLTCFKLDVVNFVEKVSGRSSDITIFSGLSLVKDKDVTSTESSEKIAELARSFPDDPEQRVDQYLMYKIASFMNSHSLKFNLMDDDDDASLEDEEDTETARHRMGGGGNRRRRKKKKLAIVGIVLIKKIIKAALAAIAFKAIALLAGKALIASLIAIALAGFLGFKSLTAGKESQTTTYEVVGKQPGGAYSAPVGIYDDHSHGYNHAGYARSIDIKLPEHLAAVQP